MADGRSISGVVQDILRNLQEMIRSEIRLAKVEVRDEVKRALSSGVWIAAGAFGAVSAWTLLLWTMVYALATTMPIWAATLIVALLMAAVGAALIGEGLKRVRRIQTIPRRTMGSVRENLEWMKQPTK